MQNIRSNIKEFPELVNETLVLLSKMGEHYPVKFSRPSAERAWRHGCRGVRLETIYLNGRRYTTVEAIKRYINRTQRTGDDPPAEPTPSMSKKEIDIARQKYRLPAAGKDGIAAD